MLKPNQLYGRFQQDVKRTVMDDDARIQMQLRWGIKLTILLLFVMALTGLPTKDYSLIIVLGVGIVALFADYWIVYIKKDQGINLTTGLVFGKAWLLFVYFLIVGRDDLFSLMSIFLLPVLAPLLFGRTRGTICCAIMFFTLAFFLWMPMGYAYVQYPYSVTFRIRFPILFFAMSAIMFLTETLRMITQSQLIESRKKMEAIYDEQYEHIKDSITDAKRSRHDIRHHFVVIDRYLKDNKTDALRTYIEEQYAALPFEESLMYCDHYGTNALLTYFVERAKRYHIEYDVQVSFPEKMSIPDSELTVVFGNLIENALEACQKGLQKDPEFEPYILVKGRCLNDMIVFQVQNTMVEQPIIDQHRYVSTKHSGYGIGLESVQGVCEKYNGKLKIHQEDMRFYADAVLMLV